MALDPSALSTEEQTIIARLRWLRQHYSNFKLMIYGQGSAKRSILDMEWSPRIRLHQASLSLTIDD